MLISVILFAIGLVLLIKGGDWFVDGATGIAKRFNLPDIVVGATVVSIGTTLPEVMVSTTGALQGSGAMAYGNAIGSILHPGRVPPLDGLRDAGHLRCVYGSDCP